MDVRVGPQRKLSTKELMLLNCSVGEDSWKSLGLQEIKPVHPEGSQTWIFVGGTDVEAESPILWPPDVKHLLIGKDPDAGKDWRPGVKGTTKDEMVEVITDSTDMSLKNLWEFVMDGKAWYAAVHGVAKSELISYSEGQLTESTNSNVISFGNTFPDILKIMFNLGDFNWLGWHRKLTITPCNSVFAYSEDLQCVINWWVLSENPNSKPEGVLWEGSGNQIEPTFLPFLSLLLRTDSG